MQRGGFDKILLLDVFLLLAFGLIMVSSASVVLSYNNFGNNYYYLKHQFLAGVLPGIFLMILLSRLEYHNFRKFAPYFLLLTFLFLLAVFVPGVGWGTKGASRWVSLLGVSFQPAEPAKLCFIIYLAAWLDGRKAHINDFHKTFLPLLLLVGVLAIPILKQPDFDMLLMVAGLTFVMYFMAGASWKYVGIMVAAGVAAVATLIKLAPYRMDRLMVFLHPELDPKGIGYQINQSLLALGSGGIFGLGLGHSRQKFNYLPEPMGDSIFAITGEELGLVGLLFLLTLYALFALRSFSIIAKAEDDFGKLLATGIVAFILLQALMNVAAITSLIPLTGTPLPFVSYGGSSVLITLAAVGILLSISRPGRKSARG